MIFTLLVAAASMIWAAEKPLLESEFIFPLEHWHNHASAIVQLPNGDLYVCWYNGSGERTADDVKVMAARRRRGSKDWEPRYTLADTPGFPDTNPTMFVDSQKRLWLFWQAIVANEWHTAITKYKVGPADFRDKPRWDTSEILLAVPRDFAAKAKEGIERWPASPYRDQQLQHAADKYFSRMGWMTRAHPVELPGGRVLVPLYSDGYDFSLMAFTDDGGATWQTSEPVVGMGAIQPTVVRKRDGTLVAYFRDNGPAPKRVHMAVSRDNGVTWPEVMDTDIPNPGSGLEAIVLKDGAWVMIYNDLEKGRHQLAVSLSDDEGKTWKWKRYIERDDRGQGAASFHYPSIIQARDGTLHASYSYFLNHLSREAPRKTIKHAQFNVEWIRQGK